MPDGPKAKEAAVGTNEGGILSPDDDKQRQTHRLEHAKPQIACTNL